MSTVSEWVSKARDVRATVAATLTRAPGRGREWEAEAGAWRASGSTEKAAVDTLAANVTTFLALYRPPAVITYGGHTAVVSLSPSSSPGDLSWSQFITRPDGSGFGSIGRAGDQAEAEAHARCNLAHAATDWHDDASVYAGAAFLAGGERIGYGQFGPAELLRYAAWQRAYRAAYRAGKADPHGWADEHAGEFTLPPAPAA